MLLLMSGLVRRGGMFVYRRRVPHRLRSIIGTHEVKRTLGTSDLNVAKRRWQAVHAEVERLFTEAAKTISNPSVAAFKAVEEWRQWAASRPYDQENEEAADLGIIGMLERDARVEDGKLEPTKRAVLLALLKRSTDSAVENSPPLSVLLDRYDSERKLPPKTKQEWQRVLARFTEHVGGVDLPVQAITSAHVRGFKAYLLTYTVNGRVISGTTVKKLLGALSTILAWAKREQYITANPAEGITVARGGRTDGQMEGRLPYSVDDLRAIFAPERQQERRAISDAAYWIPWLALTTGARLEELGQLRVSDVRQEEGVDFLAIEPGDGKRVKTKSSRRRIPLSLGFLDFVQRQRNSGQVRLFPELKPDRFGKLTAVFSKWYGRYARQACGISDPRKTLHSFRHLFKQIARGVMSEELHDALTGHSNGSVGRTYGGVPLKALAESMAKVRYAGLDLK